MGRPLGAKDKAPRSAETRANMSAAKLGPKNPGWRGSEVSYRAAHSRVERARGKASDFLCLCQMPAYDWANLTGQFADVYDYAAMCRRCHRAHDKARRNA